MGPDRKNIREAEREPAFGGPVREIRHKLFRGYFDCLHQNVSFLTVSNIEA
jgi:hypothetical protein